MSHHFKSYSYKEIRMVEMLLCGKKPLPPKPKTYADLVNAAAAFTQIMPNSSAGTNSKYFKHAQTATTYTLTGTSYGSYFVYYNGISNACRHAYPSLSLANYAIANGLFCVFKTQYLGVRSGFVGIDRNGYKSYSNASSYQASCIVDFIYYDNVLDRVMRYNPSTLSTPVEWDGKFI